MLSISSFFSSNTGISKHEPVFEAFSKEFILASTASFEYIPIKVLPSTSILICFSSLNKSDNLDDLVVKAIEKVDKTFNSKIADFSSEIQEKSSEVKSQIENYEKEVAEAAATNQQLYGKLVDILTHGAVSAKAEGSSSKSRNPKKK